MHDEDETLSVDGQREPEVMRGHRVVVAVDGSRGSRAALRFALEDGHRRDVPVEVVVAYRPPNFRADFDAVSEIDELRIGRELGSQVEENARSVLGEVSRELSGPLPEVHVRAVSGAPSAVLIRESEGADLLVLGSRGHGGFHSMLLGSTSMQCAMHATCPVTVVHSPEAHRHRLRLHRERHRDARREGQGTVEASSGTDAPA
jgi:nucleotide-binding universal stress UspA family protein